MNQREIPLRTAIWLFPIALTLHNVEEAMTLPAWSRSAGFLHPPVGQLEFGLAVTVVTLAGYAVTYATWRYGGRWILLAAAGWLLMLLNVFFPHLLGSALHRSYSPGVVTALGLNLPVNVYLLRRAVRERALSASRIPSLAAAGAVCALVVLPALFWVGRALAAACN